MVDDAARLASALASDDAVSLDGAVVARAESPRYGTLDGDDGVTARAESPRYGRFQGKSSSREAEVGS
jgi:hypothetical protein